MSRREQITLDYKKAMNVAGKFSDTAKNIQSNIVKKIDTTNDELKKVWQGTNADKFGKKADKAQVNLEGCVADLQEVAEAIAAIAKNIYDAEMEALRILEESMAKK